MPRGPWSLAVVGLGRAGQARVRALDGHPRARLAAVVRRAPGPGERSFAELLADPAIDGALLCTPNLLHAAQARELLEAGKHVAVEFPLAARRAEAEALLELARARERVLHVEHIEILSPLHQSRRALIDKSRPPFSGRVHFTGSSQGWIGDPALGGSPALRAEARLQQILDLFGPVELGAAGLEAGAAGYRLTIELELGRGGRLTLVEERAPDLIWGTRWEIADRDGPLGEPDEGSGGSLFRQDLDCFLDRLDGRRGPYLDDASLLRALSLVEAIEARLA